MVSQKTRHIKQKGILVNKKLPNIALIYNLSQASVILTKKIILLSMMAKDALKIKQHQACSRSFTLKHLTNKVF